MATLTPSSLLANSTTYTATISGVSDLAGQVLSSRSSWTFTTAPARVVPGTTPPIIIAEQILLVYSKHNNHGKPIGTPHVEIVLQYSTAMNAGTIDDPSNYQVDWYSTRKVKKRVQRILHRVTVLKATADASSTFVMLATNATKKTFAKGGQVTIVATPPGGVASASGLLLEASDTGFTIRAKATGIAPG
jgi:hypothetical protein